ncbi:uncharacterized protein LOC103864640 isoform X3 [Brassica rapa]|uniref:uncharacterized protein LOC103864640 isoform X3 n=1 Tax=Brassica campestris TaxID=3711 RepID=UPI00142E2F0E|nr:uncharacterized protein LOC103864640 isoform X3 [Brassica rapa]
MKMLQQELINNPCKRTQPKLREDQSLSDVNYSRKVLCSVIVSATKQPCCKNPDRYEKFVDEGNKMQKRLYFPKREVRQSYFSYVPSGGAVYARSHEAASSQEMMLHVSVWDRLGQPGDQKYHILSKVRLNLDENRTPKQLGRAFSAAYIEQHNETFQREVPAVVYMHRVLPPLEARKPKSGTITYTEPHIMHNFSKKRRYGIINPNSVDASVGDLSSVLQYKQAKQDVEKPSLLSSQSKKPDIFSEIVNMKQKLQQLDNQINQAKHLKKQKFGELKGSVQSGELQQKHDDTESSIIHVTNVNYAASKEVISMLFSKCGAVKNITIVTDPAAFVTFATKESVNKAIALSGTMFFSRPIKVHFSSSMCLDPYSDTNLFVFQLYQVLGVTHDNVWSSDWGTTGSHWKLNQQKHCGRVIHKGPDWFKRNGCGCGSLWMRAVAVSSGFKRFVRLVMQLKIGNDKC